MITLETEKQFEELKMNKRYLNLQGWCPDCKVIEPDLPKLEKYSNFKFVSVDRDKFIDLAIENDIMGIPSFLVYKNGELMGSYIEKNENQSNK